MTPKATTKTDSRLAARVAAAASLGAAVIHFAVTPTHWREWLLSGIFFAAIAMFQLVWAYLVWVRPRAVVLAIGVLGNLGFGALWVLSRITGAPFGPHAGEPEVVQAAGICGLMLQFYVVMGAAWLWYRGRRADPVSGFGYGLVFIGAASVIGAAATVGAASGLQDDHHSPALAGHDQGTPHSEHGTGHHEPSAPVAPSDSESTPEPAAPEPTVPAPVQPAPSAPDGAPDDGHDGHDHGGG